MKISVITVCFNAARTIGDTIDSVRGQTYQNVEHIVFDGASVDGTQDIVRANLSRISHFTSEPDLGIYDAMNKGISAANGEVIGFLNSDDVFYDSESLERIAQAFLDPEVEAVFGDLVYVAQRDLGRVVRYWRSSAFRSESFGKGWHPPHPTFYVRRSVFDRCGRFSLAYKIASDYELMLRFLLKGGVRSIYLPYPLIRMRTGGESNRSMRNILAANLECLQAWKDNGLSAPYLLFIRKPVSKLVQYAEAGRLRFKL